MKVNYCVRTELPYAYIWQNSFHGGKNYAGLGCNGVSF